MLQTYCYTMAAINVFTIREHWRSQTGKQISVLDKKLVSTDDSSSCDKRYHMFTRSSS